MKKRSKTNDSGCFVNVMDYGAKGEGDDSAAIQNAINVAIAQNKKVYFPSGVYHITKSMVITK